MSEHAVAIELMGVGLTYRQRKSLFREKKFRALDGIDLQVHRGETLGIVGRNGSGKSTLLRVMASLFKPDVGSVVQHCNSISLLSIGLGFDPELPGTDNAILQGMLLGARKSEVEARLGDIIEFSELGQFIHEPIKTYSSGMRSRLGFSVAVTMRADVLLLDEVLSVGDGKFRQKAQTAMTELIASDQTVVFVSHSLDQVRSLCDRVVWIDAGRIKRVGEVSEVLAAYERGLS